MTQPPPLPPFLRAVDIDTEPGVGLLAVKQELAVALSENARLRRQRDEARLERDDLRATDGTIGSLPPPTQRQRRRKAMVLGTAAGVGGGLFVVARLALRFVAEQWPEYAPLIEGVLALMGG